MKNTGQILKEAREKKNLSLHEIGMSLKINPKTLQAMEEGDLTKLPSVSFLKGFVKSYAIYLKLNSQDVLNTFYAEMNVSERTKTTAENQQTLVKDTVPQPIQTEIKLAQIKNQENSTESIFDNKVILSVVGAVIIVLIVGVGRLVDKYQKERQIDDNQIKNIQTNLQGQESSTNQSADLGSEGTTVKPTEPLEIENKDAASKVSDKVLAETKSTDVAKIISSPNAAQSTVQQNSSGTTTAATTTSSPPPAQPTNIAPKAAVVQKQSQIPPQATAGVQQPSQTTNTSLSNSAQTAVKPAEPPKISKPTEVIVEALNKVIINYQLGDGKSKTVELSADQFHTFKSQTVVELDISDGGAVNLIVNGRDRGVPGSIGKSIKLTYPKQ